MTAPLVRESRERVVARRRGVRRFRDALEERPWVTIGLAAAMVGVHVAAGVWDWSRGSVDGWGVVYGTRTEEALVRFGGRSTAGVEDGELWRLVSCGFLHAGPVHLFVNGLAMFGLGPVLEAVFGRARALWIFLASVVGGAVLSQAGGGELSVGASGGVFGWMGALAAFGYTRRDRLHVLLRPMFGRRLWPWVLVNLGVGAALPGVDDLAHLGGLLTGVGLGMGLADRVVDNARGSTAATTALVALDVVLLAVAGLGVSVGG